MSVKNIAITENVGGWQSIQIATVDELRTCPALLTNANAHKVEIFGTEDTLDILPIPGSFIVNATPKRTSSGVSYDIKIQFDFPLQSSEIDTYFSNLLHKKVVVIGITLSKIQKMFGSKNHPLQFDYEESNGKNIEDSAITRVKISGNITQKPVFITT